MAIDPNTVINPKNLLAAFAGTRALKANDAAYQTIVKLINLIGENQTNITNNILNDETAIIEINITIGNLKNADYVTWTNELGILPNSRQVLAGTNITLDTSIPGQITINSTGSGPTTSSGSGVVWIRDNEQDEGFVIPGPAGPQGATGSSGIQGTPGISLLLEGPQGEEGFAIPGPQGIQGIQGPTGPSGGSSTTPIVVTTNTVVATQTCWVVSESLEIASGIILEIASGARVEITGAVTPLGPIFIIKGTDQSVVSSTVQQNDNELFFPVAVNEIWFFQLQIIYVADASSTTGKIQFDFTIPSGARIAYSSVGRDGSGTTLSGTYAGNTSTAASTVVGSHGGAGASLMVVMISGHISNSQNPVSGNCQLRWAQQTNDATATTVKAGSQLIAWRV